MATLNGVNAQLYQNTPRDMVDVSEQHGRIRILKDEITLTAELTAADIIRVGGPLPKGALVISARMRSPQLGSGGGNGELDLGWQASADGAEDADDNGLLDAIEVGSAVANVAMETEVAVLPGYLKKFTGEVQIVITAVETTDAGIGDKISVAIMYIVD